MEARLKAQNAYQDLKNSDKFRQIITTTGLAPSSSTAVEYPEPPSKKRMSLVNTINDTDYRDLGLHLNAPALTPRFNSDKTFELESSLTDRRLASVSQTLSKVLPVLTASDVIAEVGDTPTPVQDERPFTTNYQHTTNDIVSPISSISSESSSDSDTNIGSSSTSSDCSTDSNIPIHQSTSTMTDQAMTRSVHTTTDVKVLINQETQTNTSYLSSSSILGTERYQVQHNVLRAFIYMLNELDSNLAIDFARLINRNF